MSELPVKAPEVNVETQRFWDATADGRIELPWCSTCDLVIFYPRAVCPDCQRTDLEWREMSGRGTVYSYSIVRTGASRAWRDLLPYVVAYVRLDEGPTMLTNIVDCDPADVAIDMPVQAVFDDTGDGSAIVRFAPTA